MAFIQGCYISQCGNPISSGQADVTLVVAEGATYTNGTVVTGVVGATSTYGISGSGCFVTCDLLPNDQITPAGSFYTITVNTSSKVVEKWVVKIDSSTPTGVPVDIKSIGQRSS